MAPKRTSKRESSGGTSASDTNNQLAQFPAPPQLLPTKTGSPAHSPRISPSKRSKGLTIGQRQFLIDNLQAEITNRARELRAEANTRAQRLRSNIELKIYQIPSAIRKATLGEVLLKYMEQSAAAAAVTAAPNSAQRGRELAAQAPLKGRGLKRNSTYILEDEPREEVIENTGSKRARLEGAKAATSAAAKRIADARILSPKSHNSRMLPLSPKKGATSPLKSGIGRPFSPTKAVPAAVPAAAAVTTATTSSLAKTADRAKAKTTSRAGTKAVSKATTASTASMRAKRTPAAAKAEAEDARRQSNESSATTNSTGTAIVKTKRATKNVNKTVADSKIVGIPAAGKRVKQAPATTAKAIGTVRGGRTLRTRA